jgi:hypothetical protein
VTQEVPVDIVFDYMSVTTFWRILLFLHFVMAVILMASITLQAMAVMLPVRQVPGGQVAGYFGNVIHVLPPASYTVTVIALYVPTFLLGAWVYLKYRTYVRIPMEQLGHWWTLGSFEFKEHVVAMGIGLLPAYWYFWRQPAPGEQAGIRNALTVFLAFTVWYAFIIGHVANDFRGVGS